MNKDELRKKIDDLVTEALDTDADGNYYVSRTKIRPLIEDLTAAQDVESRLAEIDYILSEKPYVNITNQWLNARKVALDKQAKEQSHD